MRPFGAALAVVVLMSLGCSRPLQMPPEAIEDAQIGVQVKTALVNDAQVGTRIIEVRVANRVVSLSGLVASEAEAARAIDLAGAVPGVADVQSRLVVRQAPNPTPPAVEDEPVARRSGLPADDSGASRRRLVAVGASLTGRRAASDRLDPTLTLGPMVRLGTGRGLGVAVGFSWFDADVSSGGSDTLGRLAVRPVMAGASYTFTNQAHWAFSLSLVGGMAFNSIAFQETTARDGLALDVDNSLAVRPGASLWYDVNSRVALNVFGGYVVTRPQMTFLEQGQFARRTVRADTAVFSVGLAYKVF